jgi:hypothetical protein
MAAEATRKMRGLVGRIRNALGLKPVSAMAEKLIRLAKICEMGESKATTSRRRSRLDHGRALYYMKKRDMRSGDNIAAWGKGLQPRTSLRRRMSGQRD